MVNFFVNRVRKMMDPPENLSQEDALATVPPKWRDAVAEIIRS